MCVHQVGYLPVVAGRFSLFLFFFLLRRTAFRISKDEFAIRQFLLNILTLQEVLYSVFMAQLRLSVCYFHFGFFSTGSCDRKRSIFAVLFLGSQLPDTLFASAPLGESHWPQRPTSDMWAGCLAHSPLLV